MRAEPVIEGYAAQLRQSPGQERSAFQIGEIDRQRGAGAGIAVRKTETEHRYIAGTAWSARCYMNMRPLYQPQVVQTDAVA